MNEAKGDQLFKEGEVAYFNGDDWSSNMGQCEIIVSGFNTKKKTWEYRIKVGTMTFWTEETHIKHLEKEEPVKTKAAVRWYKGGKLSAPIPSEDVPEYVDFITNDKFRQFLIDNNDYTNYIENVKRYCGRLPQFIERFSDNDQRELINHAFTWDRTPEDYNYWSDLNQKWKEIYQTYR